MSRPRRVWLGAAFAAAAFALVAPGAEAREVKRHKHHAPVAPSHVAVVTGPIHRGDYLDVGAVPDEGSDQRYFNDTKYPRYEVGPTIFQRFETTVNGF